MERPALARSFKFQRVLSRISHDDIDLPDAVHLVQKISPSRAVQFTAVNPVAHKGASSDGVGLTEELYIKRDPSAVRVPLLRHRSVDLGIPGQCLINGGKGREVLWGPVTIRGTFMNFITAAMSPLLYAS